MELLHFFITTGMNIFSIGFGNYSIPASVNDLFLSSLHINLNLGFSYKFELALYILEALLI